MARHLVLELGPDPSLLPGEEFVIVDVKRLAQSWLDPVIRFAPSGTPPVTLRREDWIGSTSAGWRRPAEPIIDGLADALQRGTTTPEDSQFVNLPPMFAPMMRTLASLIYRGRLGKVLALVADSTPIGSEVGISLA